MRPWRERRCSSSAWTCPGSRSSPARIRAPRTRTSGWTSSTARRTSTGSRPPSSRPTRRMLPASIAGRPPTGRAWTRSTPRSGADRDDPRGEPQARHVPRRLPLLRARVRHHDRRRRRRGARPGPERGVHGAAHRRDQGGRRQGDLQREPVPGQARRPARRRDGHEGRRDLYDDSVGDPPVDSYEAVINWDVDQLVTALR